MNRLKRFYDQNTKLVWSVIGVILVILLILQLLNDKAKKDAKKLQEQRNEIIANGNINSNNTNTSNYNSIALQSNQSALTGDKISSSQEKEIEKINEFFKYCNEQNLEDAYNLLTDNCKDEMYASQEDFENYYYKQILDGTKKNITVENWKDNIYRVKINEDFLSSGNYSTQNTTQDYITVEEDENNEYKLNINSYLGKRNINKETEANDIKIKVLEKDMYMDCEVYTFEVTNDSEKTIMLDALEYTDSLYLKDDNGMKYTFYNHELSKEQLTIVSKDTKTVKIKFFNKYNSTRRIKQVVFSKIVMDYDLYEEISDKYRYENYYSFEMDI